MKKIQIKAEGLEAVIGYEIEYDDSELEKIYMSDSFNKTLDKAFHELKKKILEEILHGKSG